MRSRLIAATGVAKTRPERGARTTPRITPDSTWTVSWVQTSSSPAPSARCSRDREVDAASRLRGVDRDDDRLLAELPGVGDHIVLAQQECERAAAQRRPLLAEGDQALEFVEQVGVPGAGLVPGEGAAVGRVVAAGHADLVAVVDRRGAGVGHLEERRQPQGRLIAVRQREEPGHVVAAQQVQHARRDVRVIEAEQLLDRLPERLAPGRVQGPEARPGQLVAIDVSPMKNAMQARVNR